MFVYSVRLTLNSQERDAFINYLLQTHQQDLVSTGCFLDYSLEIDTETSEVIARYNCISQEAFNHYLSCYADQMRQDAIQKFPTAIIKAKRNFYKIIHPLTNNNKIIYKNQS